MQYGSIRLGQDCEVDGSIEAVNGSITTEKGSTIGDHVENVNGDMEIQGSVINGDLSTVNGDIEIVNCTAGYVMRIIHGEQKVTILPVYSRTVTSNWLAALRDIPAHSSRKIR